MPWRRRREPDNPLGRPLIDLGGGDTLTAAMLLTHTLCLGMTGSGKTTGPLRALALALLRAGWGLVVLCAKADESLRWVKYCTETDRLRDLKVISPESGHEFNFLKHLQSKPRMFNSVSVTAYFRSVMEVMARGRTSGGENRFWEAQGFRLLAHAFTLLRSAAEPVTLANIQKVIATAPHAPELYAETVPVLTPEGGYTPGPNPSYCVQCVFKAHAQRPWMTDDEWEDFDGCETYWCTDYAGMSPHTRGSVVTTGMLALDALTSGPLRRMFNKGLNFSPAGTFRGEIHVWDCSPKTCGEAGLAAQTIGAQAWMDEVESRTFTPGRDRPVAIFIDEVSVFATDRLGKFLESARSSGAAVVMATQHINALRQALSNGFNHSAANSLLATPGLRIACANVDPDTNLWFAKSVGESARMMYGGNLYQRQQGSGPGASWSEQYHPEILPIEFTRLRCGGKPPYLVDAVIHAGGHRFSNGKTWKKVAFSQR